MANVVKHTAPGAIGMHLAYHSDFHSTAPNLRMVLALPDFTFFGQTQSGPQNEPLTG